MKMDLGDKGEREEKGRGRGGGRGRERGYRRREREGGKGEEQKAPLQSLLQRNPTSRQADYNCRQAKAEAAVQVVLAR